MKIKAIFGRVAAAVSLVAGVLTTAPAVAQQVVVETQEELEQAWAELSPEQLEALAGQFNSLISSFDITGRFSTFATAPDAIVNDTTSLLGLSGLTQSLGLDGLLQGLGLAATLTDFEWQTTSGDVTRVTPGFLNAPTPLDVDDIPGPDVIATLELTATLGLRVRVEHILRAANPAALVAPLRIEALIHDPNSTDTRYAVGYDSGDKLPPQSFSAEVNLATTLLQDDIQIDAKQTMADGQLSLLFEQFSGEALTRDSAMDLGVNFAPMPASLHASIKHLNTGGKMAFKLESSEASTVTVDLSLFSAEHGEQPTQVVIDQLPLSVNVDIADNNGNTQVAYSASAPIGTLSAKASNLQGFGSATVLELLLGDLPTAVTLDVGSQSGSFALDTGDVEIGVVELALSSGAIDYLAPELDGVLLRQLAGLDMISARITGLRKVTAAQNPASYYLRTTSGRPLHIDLSQQDSAGAPETRTLLALSSLPSEVSAWFDDSNGKTRMNYQASTEVTQLYFSTNAGGSAMAADIQPLPAYVSLCAAGNAGCTQSGKQADMGSFHIETSSPMVVRNLWRCNDVNCSNGTQLQISNFRMSYLDFGAYVGRDCWWFFGEWCNSYGMRGNLWLDTNYQEFSGHIRLNEGIVRIDGHFGAGFWTNDRNIFWSWLIPHKSGEIACTPGTSLWITLWGWLGINLTGLYLC